MNEQYATYWEAIADALPDKTALVHGDVRRTWAEFDDRAARLAAGLAELGVGHDSKVAFYLYNCSEYMELAYACFKLRAVHVNVNYRYVEDELLYLLDNSDAKVLVFHGALGDRVANVRDQAPGLKAVVQVDDGSPALDGALAYEDVIAGHDPAPRIERSGDDLYFLYTGGTTGMPKAVMWRQEALFGATMPAAYLLRGVAPMPETPEDAARAAVSLHELGNAAVHLPASPLMHGTGFFTTLQTMTGGGACVTLTDRSFDPHELWQTVQREKVSTIAIVGDAFAKPMVRALEEAEAKDDAYDLSSVQLIISSGVMWTAPVKQALLDRGSMLLYDSLGASEGVGFAASISAPGAEVTTAKFSVGEHATVITDDGREVEHGSGEIGMLAVSGPIPSGYYKDEAKTAGTFKEIGGKKWSIPGDFATIEADGTITLLGRGSVCINTGGEKVYPEEVEEAVKAHPAVADCNVVGVPDEKWGEAVTAVVALQPGVAADEEELLAAVREHLAGFKRPKHLIVVDEIMRGPAGKADYKWARALAEKRLTEA
ncbi:MAG TPA: acyl-CoA synthetase [Acidimicrobiia bacterium]|nr:acyl-CoA synthetase [Acidimicrobiia bacterium]